MPLPVRGSLMGENGVLVACFPLDRYQTGPMSFLTEALRNPTARAAVEAIFSGFVRMQRDRDKTRGCLIVPGALACGAEAETMRRDKVVLTQQT
jgi:hypothetical protein